MVRRYLPRSLVLGVALLSLTAGCARLGKLKVHPVSGTVVYKGGAPLSGGTITFQPVQDATFSVTGAIQANGTFSLHTLQQSGKVSGAPEGDYRVTILPPLPEDHKTTTLIPITLPQTFQVQARDNDIRIEIDPTALRRS